MEVDAIRGKMNEMSEAQIRMEETLRSIKEALNLVGLNATVGGGPSNSTNPSFLGPLPRVNSNREPVNPNHDQPQQEMPIGEGYQALEIKSIQG